MADKQLIVLLSIQAENYAAGAISQAESGLAQLGTTMMATGAGMTKGLTLPIAAAGVALFHFASDWQSEMKTIQDNTNMTTDAVNAMSSTVMQLGAESGASLDNLAQGYQHIYNLTQSTIASQAELKVANEAAIATGDNQANTANALANAMHEYGLDTSAATTATGQYNEILANSNHIMGVMHLATSLSNTTLDQWSENTSRATATAANLHVPIEQVSAAVATLSKHGFPDLAEAQTQVVSLMTHLIHPSQAAEAELQRLSKTTGVDLVSDFSAAGLSTKGLTGIFQDLIQAYQDTGLSQADATSETMKLLNAQRGGLGMATLLGTGYSDYNSILAQLQDTQAVNTITETQYQAALQTAGVQLHIAEQRAREMAITLGTALLPAMTSIVSGIGDVAGFLSGKLGPILQSLPHSVETFTVTLLALTAVAGPLLIVGSALVGLFTVITGPVGLTVLAIAALTAGIITLYENWGAITARVPQLATALDVVKVALGVLVQVFAYSTAAILVYWKLVYDGISNGAKGLIAIYQGLGNVIYDALTGKWGDIKNDADNALKAISTDVSNLITNVKDAPGQIQSLADSMNAVVNHTDSGTSSFKGFAKSAEQAQQDLTGATDASYEAAAAADAAAAATQNWSAAQGMLDQSSSAAKGAISGWQSKLSDAQDALKMLQDQQASGKPLNAEQQQQYADLTQYVARLSNGIKDDLDPTYIASQDALFHLQQTQDTLNQNLKDGKITQDQYNQAMSDATNAAAGSLDENGQLTLSLDQVSQAVKDLSTQLHDMLVDMGLIPPKVDTTITLTGAGEVKQGIGNIGEGLHSLPVTTTPAVTIAGVPKALSDIGAIRGAIVGVPDSFTVTANVNISGAIAAIAQLDRMMPHSPAKEGPLSQLPNWDALFAGLDASADKYGHDAVVTVKDYVDAIQSAFSALKTGLDVGALESQGGHLPSETLMGQLEAQSDQLISAMGESASHMSTDFVAAANSYAGAVKAGWDALDGGLKFANDLATSMQNGTYMAVPDDLITQIKFSDEHMIESLGDSAAVMDAEFVSNASDYANAVKNGWDSLGGALTFASNYASALAGDGVAFPPDDLVTQLKFSSEHLVNSLGDSAALVSNDFVSGAESYATAIKDGWDALGGALSFAANYATALNGDGVLFPSDDLISQIKFSSEHMVDSLGDAAALVDPDFVTKAESYATAVKDGWDALGAAVTFANNYASALAGDGVMFPTDDFIDQVDTAAQHLIEQLGQSGTTLGSDLSTAAKQFGDSVKSGFDALGAAVSFLSDVSTAETNGVDLSGANLAALVQNLAALSDLAVTALVTVSQDFEAKLAPAAKAAGVSLQASSSQMKDDATLMKDAFDTLSSALSFLEDATKFNAGLTQGSGKNKTTTANTTSVTDPFVQMLMGVVTQITAAFRDAALAFGTTGLAAAKNFAATVKPVIDLIQPSLDAFKSMEQEGILTQQMAQRFVDNLKMALSVITQLPEAAKLPLSQAQAFAATAKQIAAALQSGIDILKPFGINVTINGVTVGSGSVTTASSTPYSATVTPGHNNGPAPNTVDGSGGSGGSSPTYLTADLHIDGQVVNRVVDTRMFGNQRRRIRYR